MEELPTFNELVTLGVVASLAVYAMIQIAKPLIKKYVPADWSAVTLRFCSVIAGGGFGQALYAAIVESGEGWPWGTLVGVGAGSIATVVVAAVKKKIKNAADNS